MWTTENRGRYDRTKLRYPSDLTDAEWGFGRAPDPAGEAGREQAHGGCARGGQRDHVRAQHRLPVGGDTDGPAAAQHGEFLFPALAA